jgi:hypothetical protein
MTPLTRSVLVVVTVPAEWAALDAATLLRKLRHPANADRMMDFLAEELHRNLREPDASPDLLLARVSAEMKRAEREARAANDSTPERADRP